VNFFFFNCCYYCYYIRIQINYVHQNSILEFITINRQGEDLSLSLSVSNPLETLKSSLARRSPPKTKNPIHTLHNNNNNINNTHTHTDMSVLETFEKYQKARVDFVQKVAELASRSQNVSALQDAGVSETSAS
jgi:hypothetical protein